ncbi:hypothetical protein KC669_05060 [Candidatus Dojkabacteria bacterium]|uniref:Uncharacterized protein n=1 Tax=Candidatus Dojkabacteria bacterium TaxID=2099670 RepID=A0A955LC19_9BACT|nr:hypothetical protein [Candidatus Dojkabacteria bacterium]
MEFDPLQDTKDASNENLLTQEEQIYQYLTGLNYGRVIDLADAHLTSQIARVNDLKDQNVKVELIGVRAILNEMANYVYDRSVKLELVSNLIAYILEKDINLFDSQYTSDLKIGQYLADMVYNDQYKLSGIERMHKYPALYRNIWNKIKDDYDPVSILGIRANNLLNRWGSKRRTSYGLNIKNLDKNLHLLSFLESNELVRTSHRYGEEIDPRSYLADKYLFGGFLYTQKEVAADIAYLHTYSYLEHAI